MKKLFKRYLAIILSVAMVLTSLAGAIAIGAAADSTQPTAQSIDNDVLSEKQLPIGYAAHHTGRMGTAPVCNMYNPTTNTYPDGGYDKFINYQYNDTRINSWKPLTELLTDNDAATGLRVKSANASGIDVAIVYELTEAKVIEGFKVEFDGSAQKKFKVYAATDSTKLYDATNMIADISASDSAIVNNAIINKNAKYVAFVFTDPDYTVKEITVNGSAYSTANDVLSEEQLPIGYAAHHTGRIGTAPVCNMYNSTSNSYPDGGYDKFINYQYNDTRINSWKPLTELLTDNDAATGLRVKSANASGIDVAIVYELTEAKVVEGFKVEFDGSAQKKFKVYAATDSTKLYDATNMIADVTMLDSAIVNNAIINKNAKYVAFVFTDPDYTVKEITVNGSAYSTANDVLSAEQLPIAYAAYAVGNMTSAPAGNMYNPTTNNYPNGGYDKFINYQFNDTRINSWKPHTELLTDNDATTGFRVKSDNGAANVAIVYELTEAKVVEGFKVEFDGSAQKKFKVYAATDSTKLYDATNMIADITMLDSAIANTVAINKNAKYIAFVFTAPDYTVKEITVNGGAYSASSDVLTGKQLPIGYAAHHTGRMGTAPVCNMYNSTSNSYPDGGYDKFINYQYNDTRINSWKPLTELLTDNDAATGLRVKSANASGIDIAIVYELTEAKIINGFKVEFDGSAQKKFKVYAAVDSAKLYDATNVIADISMLDSAIVNNITINKNAKYVAFVFTDPDYTVKEISVNSGKVDVLPDILTSGQLPIAYAAYQNGNMTSAPAGNMYNPTTNNYSNGGYDRFINYQYNETRINDWKPHTELLTDNDATTGFRVKSDNGAANVAIVYEFSKVVDLSGFKINFGDSSLKKLKVYAAEDSSSLYNAANLISDINASESTISDNTITNKKAKFISFVLTTPDYTVTEIDVYGAAEAEEDLGVPSGDSILSDLIPVSYMAVDKGGTTYNFHEVRYQQSNGTIKWVFGYDVISGKGLTDETLPDTTTGTRKQFWNQFVTTLTDNDYTTNMLVKPMAYDDDDATKRDDVAVIYELSELVNLESIKINTNSTKSKNVKVYAATKITSLFGKKVADITTSDKIITADLDEPVGAGYIAFVFTGPDMYVREIEAFGSEYVAPDYGTNLVAGKNPMSIFISNREYPLAPNGDRLWASDPATGRLNDMTLIPETMGMFTDNDFSTYIAWIHDNAQQYTNTDSRYKVIAYDLGSVSTLNKILIDSRCGGYDIYASEKFNDLYNEESRVYSSGGDQLLPDGTLDPATDLEEGENLIDVAGKKARYVALVITRSRKIGVEAWDGIQLREIQVYGTAGNSDFGDNLIKGKTPIFNYRAEYSDYSLPVEWITTRDGNGLASYTDGVLKTETYIQLPISGDQLTYKYGGCVFVYYLEGTCDINAFSMHAGYYSGPGGVDVYVSESYDTLFDKENQMFTTYGEAATDSIYDKSKNLGSLSLSASFDTPKRGRYVAFVITRTYDTDAIGLSGILRLAELELYGDFISEEQLPSTTITDSTTGSTATFNYQNPDDNFVFADKGIATFRLTKIDESEYKNDVFTNSLLQNRFKPLGDAFKIEFLDKQGNVIPNEDLSGENISFELVHNSDGFVRLGEIRNNKIYLITEAQQFDKKTLLITEDFSKYKFMFLEFESEENMNYNGIVIDTSSVSSDSNSGTGGSTTGTGGSIGNSVVNNNQTNNNTQTDENEGSTNKKPTSNRQWVVVDVDDPLEWFWNIYDTFAANIWMLIVCIAVLVLSVGGIVAQIIIYKKRRNR